MTSHAESGELILGKDAYISTEFAELEAERLWPRVWQVGCREEEIPNAGDYVVYDIVDDSIIISRQKDGSIKGYHNVCSHRGRRLAQGAGHTAGFVCRYHGWRWNLEGQNTHVVDKHDWPSLDCAKLHLKEVRVGTWGGFVFINMDPEAEPLEAFLDPVNHLCANFEFEKLRYRWYRSVVFPANWKVVLEGFNEAYHVQQTHRQLLDCLEDYSNSAAYGKHGAFWYPPLPEGQSRFKRSSRLPERPENDQRRPVLAYYKEMHEQLGAMVTPRAYDAVQKINDELAEGASSGEVLGAVRSLVRQAAIDDGAGWPDKLTPEDIVKSRQDWHVFPHLVFLHTSIDGVLAYRARPNGHDPNSCIFDVWSLMRYAPGEEPKLEREFYTDWRQRDWGRILTQDFQNFADVQSGMKSRAFEGSRVNPVQEMVIANFHRVLREFIGKPG